MLNNKGLSFKIYFYFINFIYRITRLAMMYVPKKNMGFTGLTNLFSPLEYQVWLNLIIVLLFYGLFIYAVKKVHEQDLIREYLRSTDLIRIFTKQDVLTPTNSGLRIVMGMILIFALLFTSFYESTITSSFIAKKPPVRLDTLTDLVTSGYRFGGPKFIRKLFTHSSLPIMKYLYDRYIKVVIF